MRSRKLEKRDLAANGPNRHFETQCAPSELSGERSGGDNDLGRVDSLGRGLKPDHPLTLHDQLQNGILPPDDPSTPADAADEGPKQTGWTNLQEIGLVIREPRLLADERRQAARRRRVELLDLDVMFAQPLAGAFDGGRVIVPDHDP
jgi:hypothetical protein